MRKKKKCISIIKIFYRLRKNNKFEKNKILFGVWVVINRNKSSFKSSARVLKITKINKNFGYILLLLWYIIIKSNIGKNRIKLAHRWMCILVILLIVRHRCRSNRSPMFANILPSFTKRQWSTLAIIGLADFANAICVSLQAPFFPQEVCWYI